MREGDRAQAGGNPQALLTVMNVTIRRRTSAKSKIRAMAVIAFVAPIGFVVLGGSMVHGKRVAIAATMVVWVWYIVSYARIRCPRCRHLLMFRRRHQFLGGLPRYCPNCELSTSTGWGSTYPWESAPLVTGERKAAQKR